MIEDAAKEDLPRKNEESWMITVNGNIRLEKVGLESVQEIIDLAREIWIPSFRSYFDDEQLEMLFQGMYNDNILEETLSNPAYDYYFLYNDSEEPIGYLALETGAMVKIDKIYVHPSLRGHGIGKNVLESVFKAFPKRNFWLRVNRGNTGAVRLYKSLGFEITEKKDFHGPGKYKYEDYIMKKGV